MDWQCKNCGKHVEFSTEQLTETQGVVVCPQCLASEKIAGFERRTGKPKTISSHAATVNKPSSPPPHRKKITFSEPAVPPAHKTDVKQSNKSTPKRRKKSKKQRGCLTPMSAWGCLWRTVFVTLILLVAYIFFGLLLQGL